MHTWWAGLDGVDNIRNGWLLCKPLEWASKARLPANLVPIVCKRS